MPTKLNVNATIPENFITLGELAELAGKSKQSLLKLIERGIMPDANFRTPDRVVKRGNSLAGVTIKGNRLYSENILAKPLAKYIQENVHRGKKISYAQQVEIMQFFQMEREHFKLD